jgi:hypothetical protein
MTRPELQILPDGLSLIVVELGTEHVDETDLPVLRDRRGHGGHDDVLVVLLLHVIDRLEPQHAGRHVLEQSDHDRSFGSDGRPVKPLQGRARGRVARGVLAPGLSTSGRSGPPLSELVEILVMLLIGLAFSPRSEETGRHASAGSRSRAPGRRLAAAL